MNLNLKELIEAQLKAIGAEGLANTDTECGCSLGDLMPCDEPDLRHCVAARVAGIVHNAKMMEPLENKSDNKEPI